MREWYPLVVVVESALLLLPVTFLSYFPGCLLANALYYATLYTAPDTL